MSLFLYEICNKGSASKLNDEDLNKIRSWLISQSKKMWEAPETIESISYFEQIKNETKLPEDIRLHARIFLQIYQYRTSEIADLEQFYFKKTNWRSEEEKDIAAIVISNLKTAGENLVNNNELMNLNTLKQFVSTTSAAIHDDNYHIQILKANQDGFFSGLLKRVGSFIHSLISNEVSEYTESAVDKIQELSNSENFIEISRTTNTKCYKNDRLIEAICKHDMDYIEQCDKNRLNKLLVVSLDDISKFKIDSQGAIKLKKYILEQNGLNSSEGLDSRERKNEFIFIPPLHLAVIMGNLSLVQTLVSQGACVNLRNFGQYPITSNNRVEYGYDNRAQGDYTAYTPLMFAVEKGSQEMVKYLIEQNPQFDLTAGISKGTYQWFDGDGPLRTNQFITESYFYLSGKTLLDIAVGSGNINIFNQVLKAHPWRQDTLDKALKKALDHHQKDMIKALLASGANPTKISNGSIANQTDESLKLYLQFTKSISNYQTHLSKRLSRLSDEHSNEYKMVKDKIKTTEDTLAAFIQNEDMSSAISTLKHNKVDYRTTTGNLGSTFTTTGAKLILNLNALDQKERHLNLIEDEKQSSLSFSA